MTAEIQDLICDSPLAVLNVSVNSLNPAAHLALTRRPALPTVLANMDRLCARERSFVLTVSLVVTAINYAEMPHFVRWGSRHHVDAVRLLPLAPGIPVPADLQPDPEPVAVMLAEAKAEARRLGVVLQAPEPQVSGRAGYSQRCRAPWEHMIVDYGGKVIPCCWSPFQVGDLRRQTVQEVWDGPGYAEMRESIRTGAMTHCQYCREFG